MKKSELKKLIYEIVQRKLNENRHFSGEQVADSVNKIIEDKGAPTSIEILTHYGSDPIKVVEVYYHDGTIHLSVDVSPPEELKEQTEQVSDKESTAQNPADVKKQKELADLKKKQSDLNDQIRGLDAQKQKLEDPIRRKIQDIERKKAPLVKALGAITKQIQDLENK